MAVVTEDVTIGGVPLKKHYSDRNMKIKCEQDFNLYSLAYTTKDGTVTFVDTDIPLNTISAGAIVSADNVLGLSGYVDDRIDAAHDGQVDKTDTIDLGGAY